MSIYKFFNKQLFSLSGERREKTEKHSKMIGRQGAEEKDQRKESD